MKRQTPREAKALLQRRDALASHLLSISGEPNPETLSLSYGLPLDEVKRIIRSSSHVG